MKNNTSIFFNNLFHFALFYYCLIYINNNSQCQCQSENIEVSYVPNDIVGVDNNVMNDGLGSNTLSQCQCRSEDIAVSFAANNTMGVHKNITIGGFSPGNHASSESVGSGCLKNNNGLIGYISAISTDERKDVCCSDSNARTCFTNRLNTKWQHLAELPDCPNELKPEFFVYTPESSNFNTPDATRRNKSNNWNSAYNRNNFNQTIDYLRLNESVARLNVSNKKQIFIIIHGFNTGFHDKSWMHRMKDALIDLNYNVMIVKWTSGSNEPDYVKAAANTRSVGRAVVNVIQTMLNHRKMNLSLLTIVGFSLGAQMAGYIGREIHGVPRIIGLDPAGPLFACEHPQVRLDETDAKFVQVIHTNGFYLGVDHPSGHVDFYVNAGQKQPGCNGLFKASKDMCSHSAAHSLFIGMIRKHKINNGGSFVNGAKASGCKFAAFACSSRSLWKSGQCFSASCNDMKCLEPGLSLKLEDIQQQNRTKYFFNTLPFEDESGEVCGRQYLLTLVASTLAKGQIFVSFKNEENSTSDEIELQNNDDILEPHIVNSTVIVLPWQMTTVSRMSILYNTYTRFWRRMGPSSFFMSNVTLFGYNGNRRCNKTPFEIESDRPVVINLSESDCH